MSYNILVEGKGGVGKGIVSGFLVDYLVSKGEMPFLRSKADPGQIDVLFIISDCTISGIQAAGKIAALMEYSGIDPKISGLIINRAPEGELPYDIEEEIMAHRLSLLDIIPENEGICRYEGCEEPSPSLSDKSAAKNAVYKIAERLGL